MNESSASENPPEELCFSQLLAGEQGFLHALIRSLGVPSSDSADVLQAANMYLIENADKFETGTNFRAWAAQVTRYRCLNYFRSQKRRPMVNLSEQALDLITEEVCRQYDETAQQLSHLDQCLKKLPFEHASLIHAIYTEGQSLKEYAHSHKKSHTAVRKTISRVRQLLKDCIERQN
ncbi:sigma-70 family RNA polymerase sigma factor [Rubritalea spongiae]|uniref:Sigma-70 family RNA polymerase sigma factor n=1 Tax=Rubritalea spongiae TaxID=430797 RepID=A0ABW5E2R6_9BACT